MLPSPLPIKPNSHEYVHMLRPLFLKNIKHFSRLGSTSEDAEKWILQERPTEGSAVLADYQSRGQGMAGNTWESEAGKNLLVSIVLYPAFLPAEEQFMINKVVSLAVKECVRNLSGLNEISVKWPNDVYAGNRKIAGILSRSSIRGREIEYTVAGVGLNVNQEKFDKYVPEAVSLKMLTGKEFEIGRVLKALGTGLEKYYVMLRQGSQKEIDQQYLNSLYRFNREAGFTSDGKSFKGIIKGVNRYGFLIVSTDGTEKEFDIKDVQFLPD